jgi:transposase
MGNQCGSCRAGDYSQFCDLYADFREKTDLSMRQVHRAGDKVFIDYSGKKPQIWLSPETGEAGPGHHLHFVGHGHGSVAEVAREARYARSVRVGRKQHNGQGTPHPTTPAARDQCRSRM